MGKETLSVRFIENNFALAREDLEYAIRQWQDAVGGEMVNLTHRQRGERGTPVDTGRLRNSMAYARGGGRAHTINGTTSYKANEGNQTYSYGAEQAPRDGKGRATVYVGTQVEYGEIVEEGAQGRSGAHMLRNAVMDVQDFAEDFLKFALEANKSP